MFCSKCGKEIPEESVFCPSCGAQVGATMTTSQNQPMNYGNGIPQPQKQQSNPMEFLTKTYQGVPFPLQGIFSKANLLAKGFTINLIGAIGAIVAFICVFLPMLSAKNADGIVSMISKVTRKYLQFTTGWILIILSIVMVILYVMRYEVLAFLVSLLNVLMFIHTWSIFGLYGKQAGSEASLGFGFYLYFLATVACTIAPFVWSKIKETNN